MTPKPTENAEVLLRSLTPQKNELEAENNNGLTQRTVQTKKLVENIKDSTEPRLKNDLRNVNNENFIAEYEATYSPPGFTIKELRDCVPAHLFEKNLLISGTYVIVNLLVCAALFYLATYIDWLPKPLGILLWPAYWWFQGVAATGIWILAHECGHQAFSNSKTINNNVGLVLHSLLLVPYHPWRISHAKHHASTGHIGQDQVFVPKRRQVIRPEDKPESPMWEAIESSPLYVIFNVGMYLLIGWPAYLFANKSGQPYEQFTCHFLPSSPIFEKRHRNQVILSNAFLLAVIALLGIATYSTSLWTVTKYYTIPYLIVNGFLVGITLLQHTDVYLPHYSPTAWNFVRGALTTVDRDYGWFLNHALHHINDSHVAHHLFSQMPHYNAIKATPYLKEKLGEYYLYDRTPVTKALYRAVKNCCFVEDSGDVLFYRNK
jgi:omega-6 fatty acid desaturase (delta-12 desaturase)